MSKKEEFARANDGGAELEAFPPGFQEITVTIRLGAEDLRLQELIKQFTGTPGFRVRSDDEGLAGALRGERGWGAAHTHFSLSRTESNEVYLLELEFVPTSHGRFQKGVPSTRKFLNAIKSVLSDPDREYAAVIGANFSLSTETWQPTVPLPFNPPASLDHIPGLPRISGLDFSFAEHGADQPLMRAFITTYEPIQRMVIRFLVAESVRISAELPQAMTRAASRFLPSFAQRKE